MNTFKGLVSSILVIFAFIAIGSASFSGQVLSTGGSDDSTLALDERRPFDFSNTYYVSNGVKPKSILERRNGSDGFSVYDQPADPKHNEVRILATQPAYGPEGEILFWNFYGKFYKDGFTRDEAGQLAYDLAYNFPIYTFPGETREGNDRQAPIISLGEGYFDKNVLGLGVQMSVKYRAGASLTKMDMMFLKELANRNGFAADGMPIVKTVKELGQLQNRDLVVITSGDTVSADSPERASAAFILGRVIQHPEYAISPDAFLLYTKDYEGYPLDSELFFLKKFECLKTSGSGCN